MLYPLIFRPVFKEHLWGGRKLQTLFGKPLPPNGLFGESWEIADRPEGVSVIANGPLAGKDLSWLMQEHGSELMGQAEALGGRFPLLIKILDCQQPPSVQVHPLAEAAERLGGDPKTELWYVTHAEPAAELMAGLRRGVKRGQFERRIAQGDADVCLHRVPVKSGDAMFVPSGRVHAIGAGLVLIEIQQNSNTTYRVFDWNRTGPDGRPRELHVEQAMASIDFEDYEPGLVGSRFEAKDDAERRLLEDGPWFGAEEWRVPAAHRWAVGTVDRPLVLAVATGNVRVTSPASKTTLDLGPGQVCLIPASLNDVAVETASAATYLVAAPGVERSSGRLAEVPVVSQTAAVPPWQTYHRRRVSHKPSERPGILPSRRQIKRDLVRRLMYSPFLKMLVLHFWFRLVVLGFLLLGVVAALIVPKMWTTTPSGFAPVVKISLIDKVQAWMLSRNGQRSMARQDYNTGIQSWLGAFNNDPGAPRLARGVLSSVSTPEVVETRQLSAAFYVADWLLRLTRTNRADVELVCKFYDKAQLHEYALNLLRPIARDLRGEMKVTYVKTLFFANDFGEFTARWKELSPEEQNQPELRLIHAAYVAGTGAEGASESMELLKRTAGLGKSGGEGTLAVSRGPLWGLANRLVMAVEGARLNPDGYWAALRQLKDVQLDTSSQNVGYWMLLAASGDKEKAVLMARDHVIPPRSAGELLALTQARAALGLRSEALELFKAFANQFPLSEPVWKAYAAMLLEAEDWERLRGAALHMRQYSVFRGSLDALSHYYEGRAELARTGRDAALEHFNEAATSDFRTPDQAIVAATGLMREGFAAQTRAILERAETMFTNRMQYLEIMFGAAAQMKDVPLMIKTSQAMYESRPDHPEAANSYAASLLIQGEGTDKALQIMRDLAARYPANNAFRINLALALLANLRTDDARAVLRSIPFNQLRAAEVNSYYQAMFELSAQAKDDEAAWRYLDRINEQELFPTELARLKAARLKLEPRAAAPSPGAPRS